jgi:hypothetical protein
VHAGRGQAQHHVARLDALAGQDQRFLDRADGEARWSYSPAGYMPHFGRPAADQRSR